MKPAPFDYSCPDSLDAALGALAEHGWDAKILAGGQSLIPMMNFRLAQPALLLDVNSLTELDFVRQSPEGHLRLGALTRQARLEREPLVARLAPLLTETIPFVAHPQIRNRGTVGGSIAHADPAAELPAVALALDARFRILRGGAQPSERWIDARDFFVGLLTTVLEPEDLLAEVEIPTPAARTGHAFLEIARRHGDYAQTGIAAVVTLDEEARCRAARLVYLSVGDGPMDARRAAESLIGSSLGEADLAEAAQLASGEIDPSTDIHASADFKRHLARVLTVRALKLARSRAGGTG